MKWTVIYKDKAGAESHSVELITSNIDGVLDWIEENHDDIARRFEVGEILIIPDIGLF